jgi:hypothetical protein
MGMTKHRLPVAGLCLAAALLLFTGSVALAHKQVSEPPTANQPPTVTFVVSGDSCQHPR